MPPVAAVGSITANPGGIPASSFCFDFFICFGFKVDLAYPASVHMFIFGVCVGVIVVGMGVRLFVLGRFCMFVGVGVVVRVFCFVFVLVGVWWLRTPVLF